ncbi:MAG: hypothetical protein WD690_16220 [Vicinamibacterales bacterium]
MRHTKARKASESLLKPGRPPAGELGEKISDYAQMTLRLPHRTRARLVALAGMTGMPLWRVVDQALQAYVVRMSTGDRRVLLQIQERRAREH